MQPFEATADSEATREQATREDEEVVRVLDIYLAAVERGQSLDPEFFLAQHPTIAHRLRSCLAGLQLLDTGTATAELTTTELGDYRIVREIGRGGMGVVYEAVHRTDGRRVALKVLPFAAALDPRQLQRFKNEAHAASNLHHPHIVPVYEVECAGGTHFYTMQFIEGQSLSVLWRQQRQKARQSTPLAAAHQGLDTKAIAGEVTRDRTAPLATLRWDTRHYTRGVAELIRQAAEALDHAHQVGVIHRDIKPGNLLVDRRGHLWVTDFGLASVPGNDGLTATGDVLGTLRYMSPEQASARRGVVDHRTDVYSLGITLYEMLTLRPAFEGRDREEVLSQLSLGEPRPAGRLNPAVSRDLETIVLTAIAKAPYERFATAKALANDLARFLAGEPIHAKRPGAVAQVRKWAARHRSWVAAIGVFMLLATIGLSISTAVVWKALIAEGVQRSLADARQIESRRHLYVAHMNLALADWESGNVARVLDILQRQQPAAGQEDLRGFEWYHLLRRCQSGLRAELPAHVRPVRAIAASGDGRVWATAGEEGTICLWDAATYRLRQEFRLEGETPTGLAISAGGRWLAAVSTSGQVSVWNLTTNALATQMMGKAFTESAVAFSPDGKTLISTGGVVWNAANGERRTDLHLPGQNPNCIAIAPDGITVAGAGNDSQILLWDLRDPSQPPAELGRHRTYVHCLAFSSDGKTLLSGSEDGVVKLWDLPERRIRRSLRRHTGAVAGAAFSPHSALVATASWDGSVKLWNPVTDEVLLQQGHRAQVHAVSFTGDGKALLSAGADGYLRIWDLAANPEPLVLKGHKGLIRAVAFAPEGDMLVSAGTDMTARLWNLTTKQQSVLIDNSQGEQPAWITTRPDLIGGGQGGYENRLMGAVFAADERVFVADFGGRIQQWNSTVSDNSKDFEEADGPLWSLALSPDGRTLAAAGYRSNNVILWDVETKKKRFTLNGHSDRVWSVAFSPDGRTLVSGANDRKLRLWDVVNGKASGEISVPAEWIYALTFAPDNRTLAVAAGDNRIRLYNVVSGREHNPLGQHPATIRALAFFPDGKTLASGSDDGTVKLWDLTTCEERITLRVPPIEQASPLADGTTTIDMLNSSVWSLAVAKTGQALAVGDGDGRITVWRADAERDAMTTLDPVKSANGP